MKQAIFDALCVLYVTIVYVHCSVPSRSDKVKSITPYIPSDWGSYGSDIYCDLGSYAVGFRLKTQKGGSDETGVNRIELECV